MVLQGGLDKSDGKQKMYLAKHEGKLACKVAVRRFTHKFPSLDIYVRKFERFCREKSLPV